MGKRLRRGIGGAMVGTALAYPVAEVYTEQSIMGAVSDTLGPGYSATQYENVSGLKDSTAQFFVDNSENVSEVANFTNEILASLG